MKICAVIVITLAGVMLSCSKKSAGDDKELTDATRKSREELSEHRLPSGEKSERSEDADADEQPDSGDIGEDCVAFLSATKVVPADSTSVCPTCPSGHKGEQVLRFDDVKIDRVYLSGATCQVTVRILATFNPSRSGVIEGGLVGWIPAEQRAEYSRGKTPAGQQVYKVNITYRRDATGWQPIDFSEAR